MKKKSMDDPIKKKWRDKEYKFIKKHKESLREPKDCMVAFLPGADAGLVPTELEIFEKLGTPRSNLVGIENDKNVYRRLKSRKLGINLELADTEDFFKETDQKFDIISLDYSGQLSDGAVNTLKYISGRQLLNNRAILNTNFYGRMEKSSVKSLYDKNIIFSHSNKLVDVGGTYNEIMSKHFNSLEVPEIEWKMDRVEEKEEDCKDRYDFIKKMGYDNLEKIRNTVITSLTAGILSKGKELFEINPVFLRNPDFDDLEKHIMASYLFFLKEAVKETPELVSDSGIEIVDKFIVHASFLGSMVHQSELFAYLVNKGYNPCMEIFPTYDFACSYFTEDLQSYWYRSERGSPMYSDFFYVDQHRDIFEKHREFTDKIYRNLEDGPMTKEKLHSEPITNSRVGEIERLFFEHREDFSMIGKILDKVIAENLPQRVFLGSSSERPELDGKTYYEHRIGCMKKGQKKEKLWESLKKEFRTGIDQLRAYERHFNMQTYGPNYIEKETIKRDFTLPDLFNSNHPYGFLDRLPRETKPRLKNFLNEDLKMKINLTPDQKSQLMDNIAHSRWYRTAENEGVDESQIYRFFDDIMLYCIWNDEVPDKETIKELLQNSLNEKEILPERLPKNYVHDTVKGGEDMSPRGRPYISKDAALVLLSLGQDPKEIASGYRGFTPGQLRAFKAHLTMDTYDQKLTDDLAYELFGTCGLDTENVRSVFPEESTKRIGAYKAWDTMRKR